MIVIAKIGTSSVTAPDGSVDTAAVAKLCREVAGLHRDGHTVVVVTSGAVTAGVAAMAPLGSYRTDPMTLQALSAIGQPRLMRVYEDALAAEGLLAGQVLLAPLDFAHRQRYLHARDTFTRLLELGVVPIVNENDAIADDEIRFGDNDRLAALVANLVGATHLVLLTDTDGLLTADPRLDPSATLIEEVNAIDADLVEVAGSSGTSVGSGGMASKLAAARMATWSGITTVIAPARARTPLQKALSARTGFGTTFHPRAERLSARKSWIAFAVASRGTLRINQGALEALENDGRSLLRVGVESHEGDFVEGDAVDVRGPEGQIVAKGLARTGAEGFDEGDDVAVHRDDMVLLRRV